MPRRNKAQPGVMIYFTIAECLNELSNEQSGILFKAILDYSSKDIEPQFDTPELRIAWACFKPQLDRDKEHYADVSEQRMRAAFTRSYKDYANKHGLDAEDELQMRVYIEERLKEAKEKGVAW